MRREDMAQQELAAVLKTVLLMEQSLFPVEQ